MTQNMKKFLEESSKNETLKAKLEALNGKDANAESVIAIAQEFGFPLTADDLKSAAEGELSPDELEAVAGGVVEYDKRSGYYIVRDDDTGELKRFDNLEDALTYDFFVNGRHEGLLRP